MFRDAVMKKIEEELSRGEAARREGFEGRARVCARRAAGIAIRSYLEQQGRSVQAVSAYDLLKLFAEDTLTTPGAMSSFGQVGSIDDVRKVIEHLLAKVDESYSLPGDIDLLQDARWLAKMLADNNIS